MSTDAKKDLQSESSSQIPSAPQPKPEQHSIPPESKTSPPNPAPQNPPNNYATAPPQNPSSLDNSNTSILVKESETDKSQTNPPPIKTAEKPKNEPLPTLPEAIEKAKQSAAQAANLERLNEKPQNTDQTNSQMENSQNIAPHTETATDNKIESSQINDTSQNNDSEQKEILKEQILEEIRTKTKLARKYEYFS